jgi:hypothetical protein
MHRERGEHLPSFPISTPLPFLWFFYSKNQRGPSISTKSVPRETNSSSDSSMEYFQIWPMWYDLVWMARKLCSWRLATPSPKADLCHALSPRSYVVPCSLAPSFRSASVLKCVGVRTTRLALGQPKFESHGESSSIKKSHWVLVYGMVSFFKMCWHKGRDINGLV